MRGLPVMRAGVLWPVNLLYSSIIHANRDGNAERPLWVTENLRDLGMLTKLGACNLNSVLSYLEPVFLLACHNSLRDVWCWLSGRMESPVSYTHLTLPT